MVNEKIEREKWQSLLCEALEKSPSFRFLEGINPCLVKLGDMKFWIYQKNITSTAFNKDSEKSDVNRIQLPKREIFEPIKQSDIAFIFLGYDSDNDVYVTWNPYTTKQRLNVTMNVSFYSRRNAQRLAAETGDFQQESQSNGSKILAFQRKKLADYLLHIADYFPEMTEYVAVGSKRRKNANESYRRFVDHKNINGFWSALKDNTAIPQTLRLPYFKVIKKLIESIITPHLSCRKMFIKYDNIEDYTKAIIPLLQAPEIATLNDEERDLLETALILYVKFLTHQSLSEELLNNEEEDTYEEEAADMEGNPIIVNPDEKYIKGGKLLMIADPHIIEALRPLLDTEYQNRQGAMNILYDRYSEKCPNMEFRDWKKLIDGIDWTNPLPQEEESESKRKKKYVIATILADGSHIMHKNVAQTFIESIEAIGIEQFKQLGLETANVPIVSETMDEKYAFAQRITDSGYYIMTNMSTFRKVNYLYYAIEKLKLDMKVAVIPLSHFDDQDLDFSQYMLNEPLPMMDTSAKRQKIRVSFSDGTFIQQNQVVNTLLKAIELAGAQRVYQLNLKIGKKPLMRDNLSEEEKLMTKYKQVDKSLWVDTNSDTQSKYDTLVEINNKLNLGWYVEKV